MFTNTKAKAVVLIIPGLHVFHFLTTVLEDHFLNPKFFNPHFLVARLAEYKAMKGISLVKLNRTYAIRLSTD